MGEEDERVAGLGILESNTAQMPGVVLLRVEAIECDRLIANDADRAIGLRRVEPMRLHVGLGPRDEESTGQMQSVKPRKIDVAAIHDIDGASLGEQQIECVDVGCTYVAKRYEVVEV